MLFAINIKLALHRGTFYFDCPKRHNVPIMMKGPRFHRFKPQKVLGHRLRWEEPFYLKLLPSEIKIRGYSTPNLFPLPAWLFGRTFTQPPISPTPVPSLQIWIAQGQQRHQPLFVVHGSLNPQVPISPINLKPFKTLWCINGHHGSNSNQHATCLLKDHFLYQSLMQLTCINVIILDQIREYFTPVPFHPQDWQFGQTFTHL